MTSGSTLAPTPRTGTQLVLGAGANTEPTLYLGSHQPHWLRTAPVPLFISDRRLRGYRTLPRACGPWALDSGGFTELSSHGSWDHGPTPAHYVRRIRRYRQEIGHLRWAAPQDWMCEPFITARTGLSVRQHQHRTITNYLQLRHLADDLPIIPVLQGWTTGDYLHCADAYHRAGVNLTAAPLVGVGSVCRRQGTTEAQAILSALHEHGITRLHGFGFKTLGLSRCGYLLASADSMAWSIAARRSPALPGCTTHKNCANCPRYAYPWHTRVLTQWRTHLAHHPADQRHQLTLFDPHRGAAP